MTGSFQAVNPQGAELEPVQGVITARSRRQAMDWSLVLASQDIAATILQAAAEDRWLLLVPPVELDRAREAIRLYEHENRGWRWRQRLPWPEIAFDWTGAAWCVLLGIFHWLATGPLPLLRSQGVMDSVAFHTGEWWRAFTAVMLHADGRHLASNITTGVVLLGLALGRYGTGAALTAAFLAGVGGNLLGALLYEGPYRSLGASGMMMGALGLLAVQSITVWRRSPRAARGILAGAAGGLMLFLLLGSNPTSDLVGHAGGFLIGIVMGAGLNLFPQKHLQQGSVDVWCGVSLLTVVLVPWLLAVGRN